MINRTELIALLREGNNYISGQELCAHFGVSRNAIWKAINQLRQEGYEIEAVSNKGYKLTEIPEIMSQESILSYLGTKYVARNLCYYDQTDSTNTRIRNLADEGAEDGTLAVADMQTAGRGRRGRNWLSPAGCNVYMSLLLKPDIDTKCAPMITLVMALAVATAIEKTTGLDCNIKWPNDIVVQGRKVCGILTEMNMEADYIRSIIVGVGINVNESGVEEFPEEIRETATSLRIQAGHVIERSRLVAETMNAFEDYFELFLQKRNLSLLKDDYDRRLISVGREVRILDPAGEYQGISQGIDDEGQLIVELEDGSLSKIYAGEVSVRGLYGYT